MYSIVTNDISNDKKQGLIQGKLSFRIGGGTSSVGQI